ncbi:phage capsid protein [Pigmentiphaga sp. CHJ604]|uniref:phage capsid protein n=1 Tax=Pigmentiphaga sp. CHJ604 TaxID=3081984 RepID=UPI0030CE66D0
MNDTITAAFVRQFHDSWILDAQQRESRLQATVHDSGSITGSSFTANKLGATEANDVTNRLGDTVWTNQDHSTRIALMQDKDWSTPVDSFDVPKLLAQPNGAYMQNGIAALNRKKDSVIYAGLIGAALARTEEEGPYTTVVLPSSQKILSGGQGMTKAKLLIAKKRFRQNEADEHNGKQLYMLFDGEMLEDLLSDTTLTSADFMAVKMLQSGDISGKWLGFTWIPYEALLTVGNTRTTAAYTKDALHFGIGMNRTIDVGPRRDKKNATQIYAQESYGGVRVAEDEVVTIEFDA